MSLEIIFSTTNFIDRPTLRPVSVSALPCHRRLLSNAPIHFRHDPIVSGGALNSAHSLTHPDEPVFQPSAIKFFRLLLSDCGL